MENLIKILNSKSKTISCMESCTGGLFASELTNINGSSNIFKLGLVTYSNEYKKYFGVSDKTIENYTVYSNEVSDEMAKAVSKIAKSDFAVGITGQLGTKDLKNYNTKINTVYASIYCKENDKCYNYVIEAKGENKFQKKCFVINYIKEKLYEICE